MNCRTGGILALSLVLLSCGSSPSQPEGQGTAADGSRPAQMDARYVDEDADLVADPPKDPARWLDPETLIFIYGPADRPAAAAAVWQEFCDHLSKTTGKPVKY